MHSSKLCFECRWPGNFRHPALEETRAAIEVNASELACQYLAKSQELQASLNTLLSLTQRLAENQEMSVQEKEEANTIHNTALDLLTFSNELIRLVPK